MPRKTQHPKLQSSRTILAAHIAGKMEEAARFILEQIRPVFIEHGALVLEQYEEGLITAAEAINKLVHELDQDKGSPITYIVQAESTHPVPTFISGTPMSNGTITNRGESTNSQDAAIFTLEQANTHMQYHGGKVIAMPPSVWAHNIQVSMTAPTKPTRGSDEDLGD